MSEAADETAPKRLLGLSSSGIEVCPVCGSDLWIFKDGVICSKDDDHYNVDHEEHARNQEQI